MRVLLPGAPHLPLLKKLFFQLHNSMKKNINKLIIMFHACNIFKEVIVGFFISSCIHFSYASKLLKRKNIYVLAELMKVISDSKKTVAFIPKLV